ncbi:MAG TPA: class I SAM-dependent methyltransferase [Ramlibacter sp.]|uniref:class I SAM-dependent methyltransferase n=1 Tax=Ramlibacter sp. TaxID=1917967 RepID=UPI002ECFD873
MNDNLIEIHHCEVCGSKQLSKVLDLGRHPLCDDLVAIGDPRVCREYPIEILFCERCCTAHQHYQIPKTELFPSTYHYRSRHTADVLNGMRQLVEATERLAGSLQGRKVLDVGCNDGSLLGFFAQRGARSFGVEPTGAAADAVAGGHDVVNDFLTEDVARAFVERHGQPDVITFTNVFAHIEDLEAVIRSLKILSAPGTLIVVENHYLGAIVARNQFDTFYHEHPRTYSFRSFEFIAASLGMRVAKAEFPHRYGGNIRVFMTAADLGTEADAAEELRAREGGYGEGLVALAQGIDRWKANKGARIQEAVRRNGPLKGKAFPGRSAIPIKMLGLTERDVAAVYEKPASIKVGHYVPGTRIPILSDDDFVPSDTPVLLNMAWHIAAEIGTYMRTRGYQGGIIDIIAEEDFR